MRNLLALPALAALVILAGGCILVSGQFLVEFEFDDILATTENTVERVEVDLNDESDYVDNKDGLQGLADLAALGKITNNTGTPIDVELWITGDATAFTTKALVEANATRLWGPFQVPAGGMREVDWDTSASLFGVVGKQILIDELKNDGIFTVYFVGAAQTYNFDVEDGVIILVIDAEA